MRPALVCLAAMTSLHLCAQLAAPRGVLAGVTQMLLMPLVAAVLLAGVRRPLDRLAGIVLMALFFSWLGDTLPGLAGGETDTAFLLMVGCFLLAQIAYVVAFWPDRSRSVLTRPALVAPYLLTLVVLVALCLEEAGALLVPVVVYGAALTLMALLATGLGRVAGWGGIVFMASDSLIALRAFADVELPAHSFWVMLTYVAGQTLLVWGVIGRSQAGDLRGPLRRPADRAH